MRTNQVAARAPNLAPQPYINPASNPVSGPHLQTSEAERIGVDQVAKILPTGAASGTNQRAFSGCGAAPVPLLAVALPSPLLPTAPA